MSERLLDYKEAYDYASALARRLNHDVSIRKVKEYGRTGYNVSITSTSDSDYATAEIIHPSDPSIKRNATIRGKVDAMTLKEAKATFADLMAKSRERTLTHPELNRLRSASQLIRYHRRKTSAANKSRRVRSNPDMCPICGRAAGSPYRVYDDRGKVIQGCVSDFHTGHLVTPSESARFHARKEAVAIRRRLAKGQSGKGYSNPPRTRIYRDVTRIEATKGDDSEYPGQKFFHNFKRPYPSMYGLKDGSLSIKSK